MNRITLRSLKECKKNQTNKKQANKQTNKNKNQNKAKRNLVAIAKVWKPFFCG